MCEIKKLNFILSKFQLLQPQIFAREILEKYSDTNQSIPDYMKHLQSSKRIIKGDAFIQVF